MDSKNPNYKGYKDYSYNQNEFIATHRAISALERFSNELKVVRKISQKMSAVCRMYELMEEKGTHFITMEYVPGQDLRGIDQASRAIDCGNGHINCQAGVLSPTQKTNPAKNIVSLRSTEICTKTDK